MQTVIVYPGPIAGQVNAPPSKSLMQRVLAALLLRGGSLNIQNPGNSADDQAVMRVLRDAGFVFSETDGGLYIQQSSKRAITQASFGESGLAARLLIPILGLRENKIALDAAPGLRARPMSFISDILPKLGVQVSTTAGTLPASIQGPLQPADITIDASGGSQVLSGLLMAYAGAGANGKTIQVQGLVSKPYIDLTLQVMEAMGFPMPIQQGYETFRFAEGSGAFKSMPSTYRIEGDWSGAAFMLVVGAIAGKVSVTGLDAFTTQGDKRILQALMDAGAQLSIESTQVTVAPARLNAFHFNATDTPDLFPPLAALACYANGTSVIEGVHRLQHKESNRAITITEELAGIGADISLQDDYMIIRGGTRLQATSASSRNDHRIAMMCAVAALGAEGPITIEGADAVNKSYPAFFKDLQTLGATIAVAE